MYLILSSLHCVLSALWPHDLGAGCKPRRRPLSYSHVHTAVLTCEGRDLCVQESRHAAALGELACPGVNLVLFFRTYCTSLTKVVK